MYTHSCHVHLLKIQLVEQKCHQKLDQHWKKNSTHYFVEMMVLSYQSFQRHLNTPILMKIPNLRLWLNYCSLD